MVLVLLPLGAWLSACSQDTESGQRLVPTAITTLEAAMKETSGLAYADGLMLTHNDKGGQNLIYVIDTVTGAVSRTVRISGAVNMDWEDLALSDDRLFIGDMGNNNGDRTDLRIYSVDRSCIVSGENECPVRDTIRFHFPEQTHFTPGKDHNFDCEAIAHFGEHIYLYTKHRMDANTVAYRVPATGGTYAAERLGGFTAGGRVTGADILTDPLGHMSLVLIGYNKKAECFLWIASGTAAGGFLDGGRSRYLLGAFTAVGQMEAVVHDGANGLFISSENTKHVPPMLYRVPLRVD
jgi:hypothetical protein